MTLTTTPAIDTPSDALPSFLARSGSDVDALFAITAHSYTYLVYDFYSASA